MLLKKDFLKVVVIGDFVGNTIPNDNFTVTGSYKVEDLPKLVEDHKIDIFFVPSVCAETFSYTTEEIINMGFPVAVFDIGAPSERVSVYKKGLILNSMKPEHILSSILKFLNNHPLD